LSITIGALETHSSQKAMLLAVTVLGGTICGASVPNIFSRFQALRLMESVKFVFSSMSSYLDFICSFNFSRRRKAESFS
jgi:hypothetical protein